MVRKCRKVITILVVIIVIVSGFTVFMLTRTQPVSSIMPKHNLTNESPAEGTVNLTSNSTNNSAASQTTTVNWIGFEIGSTSSITQVSAIIQVPTVYYESYYQFSYYPTVSAWIGLSPNSGGNGAFFMQIGIQGNVSSNGKVYYSMFFGNYGELTYTSIVPNPGDLVEVSITFTGSQYNYVYDDLTNGQRMPSYSYSTATPSYYTQWVVETPFYYNSVFAQLPKFSDIIIEDTDFTSNGVSYSLYNEWNVMTSNRYWISQYPDVSNANSQFFGSPGGSENNLDFMWESSDYSASYIWVESNGKGT